jgi:Uma2 family endonuclease
MVQLSSRKLTLEEFLKLPETKPGSEYIDGRIVQKPMPKTRHSRLQSKLVTTVNEATEGARIAYAFPELRCTYPAGSRNSVYGGRSLIPDIAILRWEHIKFDNDGELIDDVLIAPNWAIEILSPQQSSNRVTGNILHCLKHGCQLGWLLDPDDRSVIVFQPNQQPQLFYNEDHLITLPEIELNLGAKQIFDWLKM